MNQLIRKELRESALPALFALILAWAICGWDATSGHPSFDPQSFVVFRALFTGVLLGTCFGFDQVRRERKRKTWSYLAHRGLPLATILRAKRIAAGILWLTILLLVIPTGVKRMWVVPGLEKEALNRLIEFVLLFAWSFPAYAIAQWQALSVRDRPGEMARRVMISIALSVAPLVLLAKLDPLLPASRGFMLLCATMLVVSVAAFSLASRRAKSLHSIGWVLPRFERIVSVSVTCTALLVCVSTFLGQCRNSVAGSVNGSFGVLAASHAGGLALEEFNEKGVSRVISLEGQFLPWHDPVREETVKGRTVRVRRDELQGWYHVLVEWALESSFRPGSERVAPFTLTRWRSLTGERSSGGELFLVQPGTRLVNKGQFGRTFPIESPLPDLTALFPHGEFSIGFLDSSGGEMMVIGGGQGGLWNWHLDLLALLFERGSDKLALVASPDDIRTLLVPGADRALECRIDLGEAQRHQFQNGRVVLVGEKGEYIYNAESRSMVAWIDDTPELQLLRYKDPLRGETVLTDGRAVVRHYDDSSFGGQRKIARAITVATTLLGTPVSTVASTLLEAPWFPERTFTWTFLLDWGVAGGRRLWLTGLHLLLAAVLSWRVSRRLAGRRDRRVWIAVTLALGCVGYLLARLEAYGRRETTA